MSISETGFSDIASKYSKFYAQSGTEAQKQEAKIAAATDTDDRLTERLEIKDIEARAIVQKIKEMGKQEFIALRTAGRTDDSDLVVSTIHTHVVANLAKTIGRDKANTIWLNVKDDLTQVVKGMKMPVVQNEQEKAKIILQTYKEAEQIQSAKVAVATPPLLALPFAQVVPRPQLSTIAQQIPNLSEGCENLKATIKGLEERVAYYQKEYKRSTDTFIEQQQMIKSLDVQLATLRKELTELSETDQAKIKDLEAQKQQAVEKSKTLEENISKLDANLKTSQADLKQKTIEHENAKKELEKAKKEISTLTEKNTDLKNLYDKQILLNNRFQQDINKLDLHDKDLQSKLVKLTKEYDADQTKLQKDYEQTLSENSDLVDLLDKAYGKLFAQQSMINLLNKDIKNLTGKVVPELQARTQESEKLRKEEAEKSAQQLQEERAKLDAQRAIFKESMNSQLKEKDREVANLNWQLTQALSSLDLEKFRNELAGKAAKSSIETVEKLLKERRDALLNEVKEKANANGKLKDTQTALYMTQTELSKKQFELEAAKYDKEKYNALQDALLTTKSELVKIQTELDDQIEKTNLAVHEKDLLLTYIAQQKALQDRVSWKGAIWGFVGGFFTGAALITQHIIRHYFPVPAGAYLIYPS